LLAYGSNLVTPLPSPYLRILIEGLRSEVVVNDLSARQVFNVNLAPYEHSLQQALNRKGSGEIETYFMGGQVGLKPGKTHKISEGMFIEQRRLESSAEPRALYAIFSGIGGKNGWFYLDLLWKIRGMVDVLAGGPGMRRGQRNSEAGIHPGDVLGGYRVEMVEEGRLMRLRNEMKAPGPAWMQFEVLPRSEGGSLYIQTAFFEPHGLAGLAYWYSLFPFHQLIFNGMARAIVRRAENKKPINHR